MKTKLLLTGGSGQLGEILISGLRNDCQIHVFDQSPHPRKNEPHETIDISDLEDLKMGFSKLPSIQAIIHFAADAYPFASWENVLYHNIAGTKNIYECAKEFKVPKVIFASSTHVVGAYPGYPMEIKGKKILKTTDPVRPDGFYALSKATGELIGQTYSDLHGISSINLRIGHTTAQTIPDPDLAKVELFEDDLVDLVKKSLTASISFGIYFAVSDNPGRFLDIENAKKDLGYSPKKR